MPRLDLDVVRHALSTAQRLGYREVELGLGEDHFHAKLVPFKAPVKASDKPAGSEAATEDNVKTITASGVGYYRPGAKPLAAESQVSKGDKVAIIVSLGIENDVESRWSGTILEVLVKPEQPVEYGQPLARITIDA